MKVSRALSTVIVGVSVLSPMIFASPKKRARQNLQSIRHIHCNLRMSSISARPVQERTHCKAAYDYLLPQASRHEHLVVPSSTSTTVPA
jgi:hypothetical protein